MYAMMGKHAAPLLPYVWKTFVCTSACAIGGKGTREQRSEGTTGRARARARERAQEGVY